MQEVHAILRWRQLCWPRQDSFEKGSGARACEVTRPPPPPLPPWLGWVLPAVACVVTTSSGQAVPLLEKPHWQHRLVGACDAVRRNVSVSNGRHAEWPAGIEPGVRTVSPFRKASTTNRSHISCYRMTTRRLIKSPFVGRHGVELDS